MKIICVDTLTNKRSAMDISYITTDCRTRKDNKMIRSIYGFVDVDGSSVTLKSSEADITDDWIMELLETPVPKLFFKGHEEVTVNNKTFNLWG